MKIIQVVNSLSKLDGGPTFTVTNLSKELAAAGCDVSLLSLLPTDAEKKNSHYLIPPSEAVSTYLVSRPCCRLDFFLTSIRRAVNQLTDKNQVLVHVNGLWLPSVHAAISEAKKAGAPIMISPHGMLEPWTLKQKFWKKKAAWWVYQRRDLLASKVIHATSEEEVENLRCLGFRQPIAMIPNGIPINEFNTDVENKARFKGVRKDLKVRTVLFLSRIHPKKGLLELVEAWSHLKKDGWRIVIAGPDPIGHRAEVEALIERKGLIGDFEFTGAVDGEEKLALYSSADLFVLPTYSENFGVVIAEALASGLPVITTTGAPWSDLVTYDCGWWVEPTIKGLVDAFSDALTCSTERLNCMGERGRKYITRFDWPNVTQEMLETYRWMLNQGSMPDCVRLY